MKILLSLIVALAIACTTGCATRIGPGHVGIQVDLAGTKRGVQDYTVTTGWAVYNPFSTSIFEYPTYVQTYVFTRGNSEGDESFTFNTAEGMSVNVDVNLSYQLEGAKAPAFYVKFRNDDITQFTFGYLHNMTRDCFTRTGGHFSVENLMGNSAPFVDEVRTCLQSNVSEIGVQIQSFGIVGSIRPPQQIIDSINSKLAAQQNALKTEMEVNQSKAEALKQIAQAEGAAKSKIAIAEGEATANKKLAESLSPSLLEWRKLNIEEQAVNKWNGQRPTVEGNGSGLLLTLPTPGK
jgi:regulator of protease activity HflC (stomatin/prohibitin superfamily)